MRKQACQILAVEPDAQRGHRLKQLVRTRLNADIVVVGSAEKATAAMASRTPDVLLLSAFVPPQDESELLERLRTLDPDADLPVLTVPPAVDSGARASARRGFSLFGRSTRSGWPLFDANAVATRIEEALAQSKAARSRPHVHPAAPARGTVMLVEDTNRADHELRAEPSVVGPSVVRRDTDERRHRAHRWTPAECPWLGMVETTWGLEVRVLNISRSGILVESSAKFDGDKPARFRLHGPDAPLVVPARIVRTEIAEVDRRGVRYQVAAVFERGLDLFPERPDLPKSGPAALAELLVRVTAEMGRDQQRARGLFEQGLLQLVAAREIRISEALAVPPAGYESVYFTVPDSRGRRTILQAVFERDHEPAAEEFRMLKAAAAAAAVVLLYERERPLLVAKSA